MSAASVQRQPLHVHLLELRRRTLWSAAAFAAAAACAYQFHSQVIGFLLAPLHQSLYYTTPQGGFEFLIRISAICGLIIVVPVIAFQLIKFVEPALSFRFERKFTFGLMLASLLLLLVGVGFGYLVILPLTLHFFAGFGNTQIKPLISAADYLSLVMGVLATFAVLFQLPLVVLLINRITPLTPGGLMKYQKHVIIGSLVISLVLPFTYDPLTQFVMAVPIIGLYEISILLVWFVNRKRARLRRQTLISSQMIPQVSSQTPLAKPVNTALNSQVKLAHQPLVLTQPARIPNGLGPRVIDLRPKAKINP